jgi:UDP-N-acetylmuramyl pentapeptide phosphotransferase/UDP-N-acetylglucosamine-1-phosphate transferase
MVSAAVALLIAMAAAALSAGAIVAMWPLLRHYALARPNARSSHSEPTPQGGGMAVIGAALVVVGLFIVIVRPEGVDPATFGLIAAATVLVAVMGAIDDLRPVGVMPRLALQAMAAGLMLAALPAELRVVAAMPWWVERALMLLAAMWFINFTNFMDGIDWIVVAEMVPITLALAVLATLGALPQHATVVAVALCGAMLGFAPFNRPVARLFLGDVGSLPIGLLLAWLMVTLAGQGHLIAALLLPLYFAADATITLGRRLLNGERIWEAHRTHFYQRAIAGGFTVSEVVARVFMTNVVLALLAIVTVRYQTLLSGIVALIVGLCVVAWLLQAFAQGKSK